MKKISKPFNRYKELSIPNKDDRFELVQANSSPCISNITYALGNIYNADSYTAKLEILKWDTATGEYEFIPIRKSSGEILKLNSSYGVSHQAVTRNDNTMTFIHRDNGIIYHIDVLTGKIISSTATARNTSQRKGTYDMRMNSKYIFTLFTPEAGTNNMNTSIRIIDRRTLRKVNEIALQKSLVELLSGEDGKVFQGSFAVNPEY